jgi:hypothetical protein
MTNASKSKISSSRNGKSTRKKLKSHCLAPKDVRVLHHLEPHPEAAVQTIVARNAKGCLLGILTTTVEKRGLESIARGSDFMTATSETPDVRHHRETVVGMRTPVAIRTTEIAGTTSGLDTMIAGRRVTIGVILAMIVTVAGEGVLCD